MIDQATISRIFDRLSRVRHGRRFVHPPPFFLLVLPLDLRSPTDGHRAKVTGEKCAPPV